MIENWRSRTVDLTMPEFRYDRSMSYNTVEVDLDNHRVVTAYQTKAKPLFDKIAANCFETGTLGTLRDTLLPKLLSGELSVLKVNKEGPT